MNKYCVRLALSHRFIPVISHAKDMKHQAITMADNWLINKIIYIYIYIEFCEAMRTYRSEYAERRMFRALDESKVQKFWVEFGTGAAKMCRELIIP